MNINDGNIQGDLQPLKFDKVEEGKKTGMLSSMPRSFREKFHKSISSFLTNGLPTVKVSGDWSFSINDTDEGLSYQLHYKKDSTDGNYVVICRVSTYNLDTKEMLPADQDTVIVFKFSAVDDLLKGE